MKLHYSSTKLKKILTDVRLLNKHYGQHHIKIRNRLSELKLANNLSEIPVTPPPRRHKLKANYNGCWGIDYYMNFRIVIEPIGIYDINDISSIIEINIVCLEDYH